MIKQQFQEGLSTNKAMDMNTLYKSNKGNAAFDIVIFVMIIIFIIFPVFSVICEKYMIVTEAQFIKDSLDMTNLAAYNAMNNEALGRNVIRFDSEEVMELYKKMLAKNLKLNEDLTPTVGSIAEGRVTIDSLICYTENLPVKCLNGRLITRPSIHSVVTVPVRPVLYRQLILELTGREYLELKVRVDSELPVNN
jgi:hypothetical protein